jgi:uncharacterized SAM-dependent methyltransferase
LQIQVCLTEKKITEDFFRSVRKGKLEERFFYWFPPSVVFWLRLCRSQKYLNYRRSLSLAAKASKKFAETCRAGALQWISLGSGQGAKEIPFLEALLKKKKRIRYFPVDSSQSLLEMAVLTAGEKGIPTVGLKADFENPRHLKNIPRRLAEELRVVNILGNTLGDFRSKGLLKIFSSHMKRGDFLFVDGELYAGKRTLAGYDHPDNRRFVLGPLLSMGISERDGALQFKLKKAGAGGLYCLSKSFRFHHAKKISYFGQTLSFPKGHILKMSPSYKYDSWAMKQILERTGLFRVREFYESSDSGFGLWLAERA